MISVHRYFRPPGTLAKAPALGPTQVGQATQACPSKRRRCSAPGIVVCRETGVESTRPDDSLTLPTRRRRPA